MSDPIRLRGTFGQLVGVQPPPADVPLRPDMSPAERLRLMRVDAPADTLQAKRLESGPASRPVSMDLPSPPGRGRAIAQGVWYADDRRTRDGAPVRVVTVDTRQARLGALYSDGLKGMSPKDLHRHPQFVAAVNGTFFGQGVIGDMRGFGRTYTDEAAPIGIHARAADQASDQRFYVGVLKDGQVVTGKGGLSESGLTDRLDAFQGGLGVLFTREQAPKLEADITSGAFAARQMFRPVDQEQSIARSFLGVTADGKVLMVTMGAGDRRGDGAGFAEAARIMRTLGAAEAYVLDGGGSTSMLVKGVAETRTDGRQVKNYLAVFARSP
jgi:hypothetical protein